MRKKHLHIIKFTFLIYTFLYIQVNGQQYSRDPRNMLPYAPETSSLLRYQEIPVSNYTGVPNISIPIFNIKSGSLEIPLTLNYHSGGILVSDISGPVGLGWSIHTIDPITRKINGFVDEHGIMMHDDNVEDFLNQDLDNKLLRMNAITNTSNHSASDIMPDDFTVSIPGFSGQFNYNSKLDKFVTFPFSNLKFDYEYTAYSTPQTKSINRLYVKDDKGITYSFGATGRETVGFDQTNHFNGTVAWKINGISHQNGGNIYFNYINNHYRRWENGPRTIHSAYSIQSGSINNNCTGATNSQDPDLDFWYGNHLAYSTGVYPYFGEDWREGEEALLTEISAENAKISFFYSSRLDFDDLKKLDKIVIKDNYGQFISEKRFNYDYFTINETSTQTPENLSKRLKLLSIQDCDVNGNCITTRFDYYENFSMYGRKSRRGYDYWGYFNNNPHVGYPNVPIKIMDTQNFQEKTTLSGSLNSFNATNRNVNPNTVNTYSLKSITYPEGGISEFIYEPNIAGDFFKKPEDHQYYFDGGAFPDMTKKYDSFTVSGYVEGSTLYTGFPQHSESNDYSKTYIKEIDLSNYNKNFELRINNFSNFKASTFSNNLNSTYLHALLSIYYYNEQNVKTYWIQDSVMDTNVSTYFHRYNNQPIPNKKVYVAIKHVYWGGLGLGNITQLSIPYSSNFYIEWDEKKPQSNLANFYAGGIRIKELRTYNANAEFLNSVKYKYLKEDETTSSGILFDAPIFSKDDAIIKKATYPCSESGSLIKKYFIKGTEVSDIPKITGITTQGKSVGYSRVEVSKVDNAGNTKGKEIFEYHIEPPFMTGDNFLASLESNVVKREFIENRDWRNGQLLKHIVYDNNNQMVKKLEKSYHLNYPPQMTQQMLLDYRIKTILYRNIFPGDYKYINRIPQPSWYEPDATGMGVLPTYISVDNIPGTCSGCYTPVFIKHPDAFLLKEDKITEYFGNKEVITKTEFDYNSSSYPLINTAKTITSADNSIQKISYQYAQDKGNQLLLDKNMVDLPLETSITQTENGVTKIVSRTETVYPTNNTSSSLVLPLSVKTYDVNNNSQYTEVTYDEYDHKGNVLQYTTKENIPVTIIWGYTDTKPILKLEGAKYQDIYNNSLLTNAKGITNNNGSETDLLQALDNLRKDAAFSNYRVTTYTHKPLIGVKSITPPNGIREIYQYDSFNRLKAVEDIEGKILKEYKYNYAPQSNISINTFYNVEMNQTLYRNNCPTNYIAGSYNYNVPAAKYSSNISLADANQKAMNEINTIGQNLANTNATCTPAADVVCQFTPTDNYYISHYFSSFVYKPVTNSVNVQYVFALPYQTSTLDWSQGVYVGSIPANCAPSSTRTVVINNGSNVWNMNINTSGQLILKLTSGSIVYSSNPITFNFQYQK
ncbi:hypothetical protein BA768_08855 [Chryseobacterium sp. CBo1]|uniref:DUF5977 domain-containing protein n=1 Tax=Chryseobacterium sp. CBo1 TaxID=1869230 RepID=UPI00081093B7|nr:DUF5977 domain-containing protein [Chryseobacterium sp. CBo1]OCK49685.1 hypothetical protein BA768_08855 [Chryseobacterium sp. CBo1]